MSRRKRRNSRLIWRRAAIGLAALIILLPLAAAGFGAWILLASRATVEGNQPLPGLGAPVEILRDQGGVPTLTATSRPDLARGLGFIHAQERFFQMDLLRRAGAGELSALVGAAALPVDRARRVHRFRAHAASILAAMPAPDRALLAAYTDGVNAGLATLGHAPWEYTALRVAPAPWAPEDTLLAVYAMYFDLQDSDPDAQLDAAAAGAKLGPDMAAFLYPKGVPADAPLDGSHFPEPPIPVSLRPGEVGSNTAAPPPTPGSNNFAVSGQLSATGAAIVENDMHLDLRVPNIWFRARMVLPGALNMVGVTLPGAPFLVVGSNTHIAWAFTDSYIESGDAVTIETLPGGSYKTPDGPRPFTTASEEICVAHAECEALQIHQTIWGPVISQDSAGRPVVWRWMAHDENAVRITGFLGLERAQNIRQALDAAHTAGMPDQNLVVGDSAGHIAWTVIGQIPRRVGLDDQLPQSWADGTHGWRGYLAASEIPEIIDPPDGRLWSANARMLGGAGYALLGNGGYAGPSRAGAIHDDLMARSCFTEADMLAIATDARAHTLDPWQNLLLKAIDSQTGENPAAALRPYVTGWGGSAVPDSVGYRLVHDFRANMIKRIYAGLAGPLRAPGDDQIPEGRNPDWPSLRLLAAQPPALVPPPFTSWPALISDALRATASGANSDLAHYTWGARNHTGIRHPIAAAIPGLHMLTDPPDIPVAGDTIVPRVAVPGFGASERIVVSPGHEDRAIFDMPAGQAGNPLSPYYGNGEQAWVDGAATPLLPGPPVWHLRLVPLPLKETSFIVPTDFDCVIAGAGIVGTAIAREMALRGHSVLLLEELDAPGTVTSARNSGVIHAGLYYPQASLRARLCVAGRRALYAFCQTHHVDARACGKLVVAADEMEIPALRALAARAAANGVEDLQILTGHQARAMEPQLHCAAALWSPVTGIVDTHALLLALLGVAQENGATLATHAKMLSATAGKSAFTLRVATPDVTVLTTRILINAAGHGACDLARKIEGLDVTHVPKAYLSKGSYFTLLGKSPFSRLVYPMPIPGGAGVHLTLDLGGQARFGPDVESVEIADYTVDPARAESFASQIRRYWPALPEDALQPGYAGIRPKIVPANQAQDFVIQGPEAHGVNGLVNLFGIESPGLTSCLAIATETADRIVE